jgi:hypothetical protein
MSAHTLHASYIILPPFTLPKKEATRNIGRSKSIISKKERKPYML